jgi:hypothetical protein
MKWGSGEVGKWGSGNGEVGKWGSGMVKCGGEKSNFQIRQTPEKKEKSKPPCMGSHAPFSQYSKTTIAKKR